MCVRVCVYALRITSRDKIVRFKNTFIIVILKSNYYLADPSSVFFCFFLPWWLSLPPASWMLLQHFSSCILRKPLRLACMCVHHSLRIMLFTWTYVILYFMVGGVQCILLTMQQNIFRLMHPWWCKLMLHRVVVFCGGFFLVMCAYVHMCEYRVKSKIGAFLYIFFWHLHRTAKCLCSPANVLFWLSVSVILLFVCLGGLRGWGDENCLFFFFFYVFCLAFFFFFLKEGEKKLYAVSTLNWLCSENNST